MIKSTILIENIYLITSHKVIIALLKFLTAFLKKTLKQKMVASLLKL